MTSIKTPKELSEINGALVAHNEALLEDLALYVDELMEAAKQLKEKAEQLVFSEDRQVNLIKDICVQTANNAIVTLGPNVVMILAQRSTADAD